MAQFNQFRGLPEHTSEADIQSEFNLMVHSICIFLDTQIKPKSETKVIIGGLLAWQQFNVTSRTDSHFLFNNVHLLASEIKTAVTFPMGHAWYQSSRGIQVLAALYAYNCPTLLFTQQHWKLFVEPKERNFVMTFPFDDNHDESSHINSTLMNAMGRDFLKVIVICILSRREVVDEKVSVSENAAATVQTPAHRMVKDKFRTPQHFTEGKAGTRTLGRIPEKRDERADVIPSFVSGYKDGKAIYSFIRVVPENIVSQIEDEIVAKEQVDRQTSDSTLFDPADKKEQAPEAVEK